MEGTARLFHVGSAAVERQFRKEFSFLFDIDPEKIELDMKLEDLPEFSRFDRQLIAMVLVEAFGTTLSDDEDFYSLETVGDVFRHVMRQR
jgi:acyl carrier protein